MTWLGSYLGSTWALVLVVALVVAALGAIAFFARNWKAAVASVLVLGCGFAYLQVDKNAYARRVAEEAAEKVAALEARINVLNAANESDAMQAIADQARISQLEDQARAKAPDTPQSRLVCLDRSAARRVSAIRYADPGERGTAAGTGRHSGLLSRGRGTARP